MYISAIGNAIGSYPVMPKMTVTLQVVIGFFKDENSIANLLSNGLFKMCHIA